MSLLLAHVGSPRFHLDKEDVSSPVEAHSRHPRQSREGPCQAYTRGLHLLHNRAWLHNGKVDDEDAGGELLLLQSKAV